MLFKRFIYGKASLCRPFLLFILYFTVFDSDLTAQDLPITRREDPVEYIQRIEMNTEDSSLVWDTSREFASQLKYPGKVENSAFINELSRRIATEFGFYLYQQMAFLKQVDGAVFAELDIEFQQNLVIARIHDIYFIDYDRDRYGKFSPKSSKKYTLEDLNKKRERDPWQQHLITIDENMRLLLNSLSKSILEIKATSLN